MTKLVTIWEELVIIRVIKGLVPRPHHKKSASPSGKAPAKQISTKSLFSQVVPALVVFLVALGGLDLDDDLDDQAGAEDQGDEAPAEDDVRCKRVAVFYVFSCALDTAGLEKAVDVPDEQACKNDG